MATILNVKDAQHYSQPSDHHPQQHSPTHAQHPLWHSEQNPDAPPQHLYHPPQSTMYRQAGPYLVATDSVAAPVSQQVPLAQRRQNKKITQRREETEKEKRLSGSMEKDATSVEKEDMTKVRHQGTPSSRLERVSKSISAVSSSRPLSISGLLSAEPSKEGSTVPRTNNNLISPVLHAEPKYSIRMRQEPIAARACGFGERDRRVIDPPPILQMHVDSSNSTKEEMSAMLRSNYCVVHCTLWDPATDKEDTAMPGGNDKRQQRRLMGTLVSSPFVGKDEHNVEGCFFTFPDLSVRTPGTYALKFSLVVLDPMNMRPGGSAMIRSSAMSAPFQVWNAKDFCGMRPSTELTKRLKHQGCLISVKKGNAKTNGMGRDDDEEDEDDYGDDGAGQRKKVKR